MGPLSTMSLLTVFQQQRALLSQELRAFIAAQHQHYDHYPLAQEVLRRLEETSLSGKQWRGVVAMMMSEWLAGADQSRAKEGVKLGVAVELMQSAFLIHDDIIDQDMLRRGRPSMPALYAAEAEQDGFAAAPHYGISQAICVGDISFFLMQQMLLQLHLPADLIIAIWQHYVRESVVTGFAQMRDIAFTFSKKTISPDDVLGLHRDKTARYSFCLPFLAAATMQGQSPAVLQLLEEFGEKLGTLFQIKDDELGLFGTAEQLGKPAESDMREGKQTLHYLFFLQTATEEQRRELAQYFGNPELTQAQFKRAQELISATDAVTRVEKMLVELETACRQLIPQLPIDSTAQKFLHEFIDLNLHRQR